MEWEPTRWWRAVDPDGSVWSESSSEKEVRGDARPDDTIQQLMRTKIEERWETR